jgi:hypothetical protein
VCSFLVFSISLKPFNKSFLLFIKALNHLLVCSLFLGFWLTSQLVFAPLLAWLERRVTWLLVSVVPITYVLF